MPSAQALPASTIHLSPAGDLILSGWNDGPDITLPEGLEGLHALRSILRARRDAGPGASAQGIGTPCQPLASTLAAAWRHDTAAMARAEQAAHSAQVLRTNDVDALAALLSA